MLEPKTAFYDWLYLQALCQNRTLADQLLQYSGFTDIEFNPKKSFSTQARSCALFVALCRSGHDIKTVLLRQTQFIELLRRAYRSACGEERSLFE